ncbi:non-ribosomal peptide synthetase [Caballeronia pedi]|uniref:Non-ribosomal peptide synthetase n=1 Tax=Caballeronia pedi TaxID=1777141 RepID=A0A158E7G4_9BURK|nr:non-ribosomal peptide synthetase [Caballeronia pedi]SAL01897.1 non-ribosomal peptide synthetase [Caballeronia pedi]
MSDTTIAAVPDLLAVSKAYVQLPEEKRKQFRHQLRARGMQVSRLPIVPFPDRGAVFPLSHAQERMWFLWKLDPSSAAYNITGAVRLQGTLDRRAVKAALDRVVARHESLRKHFVDADGVPMQIAGAADYGWRELDVDADVPLADGLDALGAAPFDLERGPLLRATLLRRAPDDHVLHVAIHHIVSDGLSVNVFVDEFVAAYRAECGVSPGALREVDDAPIQYGDFAAWQREWLDDESLAGQLSYWREELGGEQPVLELPFDRPRTGMRGSAGASVMRVVAGAAASALRKRSQSADATLFTTLLAAYQLLLSKYSGQDDIRVGVPVSGRDRDETERVIGFFVNTLVLRARMSDASTFGQLLAQMRERTLTAFARQDVPFSRLVQELQPQRSFGHTPLFQTMFNYLGPERAPLTLPGLTVSDISSDLQTARFDLVLTARERGEGLEVSFTYARDVFDESTVARMLDHYVALLEQLGAQGDAHLGALTLEALQPQPMLAAHAFASVGERIAARAQRMPEANAVHCEGERLSYGALQAWSARIAHALQARGIGAESRVGLCLTRSPALIAALVGVLRSGGAFVPLDPAYPAERLGVMLEDAGVRCVVADAATIATCGALFAGLDVIDVNQLDAFADVAPRVTIQPEQLAYVIYTSGSTGKPKGVAVSHVALSRHLDDFIGCYGITSRDTQLQSSTINFDVALHEMLPALMQGGQVEMRGPQLWDIDTTSRHLRDGGVSFSRIPTAYWQQWLRTPPPAQELATLRQITVGGEGLPGDALAQWRRGPLAHIRLDNLYGPTETTVACMYRATTEEDTRQSIVSIGEPYASRSVQVLDRFGNEVPVGGLGELCIGGLTLARGYLNRPGLTAERFVPDPRTPGARLYRSGDLCRRRADGSIDFLGRLDQQVKLRGFRIELGEIEAALRQAEGVSAAVVALAGEGEARQLVGYVVGQSDIRTLRRTLEARLPGYMVPAAFVTLDALPLMQNGKVDRAALPAPQASAQREHVAPRTALEGELLSIWQAVLGRERIGVTENFFEIGGHSLLMMQVASRIRQELGREVTLATLFMHPVLESLAAELEAGQARAVAPIARRDEHTRIPLTYAQERLWFLWNLEPASAAYTIAGAVRLKGRLDKTAMRRALDHLVMRHESLRTRFVEEDGQAWQVVDETPRYQWSEARYEGEAQLQALSQAPLDLRAGPMLRVALLEGGAQDAVLHFAMPHIVSDAWSQTILLREFSQFYAAAVEEQEAHLEPLPIQYGDYATWQREHLNEAALQAQYAYWQHELGDEQPLLELPVDRVRHGARDSAGASIERRLDPALASRLDTLSKAHGATRFMTMLAAFGLLLGRYSGQQDIRIGVPEAGRDRLETEPLIGFFVNTLVIRVRTHGTQPFDALLADVRQRVLDAQAHSGVPFAKLVEHLQPQRSASHTPLFQVLFNYAAQTSSRLSLPGVDITPIAGATGSAQFDLSLQVDGDDSSDGLTLGLNYATDIFDAATARRLLDDYVTVLSYIADDAAVRAAQIEFDGEARAFDTMRTLEGYAFEPVPERIAQQAARTPDAPALRCGDETLTYAELDDWATRIAAQLQACDVSPEARVGICVSRSAGLVAALIGVMRSGAAYVPLDTSLPPARIEMMLDDAGVACVIADETGAQSLEGVVGERTVLRIEHSFDAVPPASSKAVRIYPSQLAYVIYTSGSTGKPKGVGVSHDALARFLASMRARPGIGADDVCLSVTTLSFDIAALELYLPLIAGARIELASRDDVTDGERLAALISRSGATMMQATPMGWKVLLEGGWQGTAPGRGFKALCGGEALPRELAARMLARGVDLWNLYGPTETTVWSSVAHLENGDTPPSITLGEPIEGTTLHLIDASGARVPAGGIGELCIGGTNLARGYLGRAALTAERFVPDPLRAGARLYRTGDLCRMQGGRLVFVGRADHQVKLRGFRIELGEIEAQLRRLHGVRDAAAVVRDVAGEPLLVAYVVHGADAAANSVAWQAQLARDLPPYMVPQRFVTLDALPLTHNNKLDRNALPAPQASADASAKTAPGTATELAIASIWTRVLGVDDIGAHDDFFALGGESLKALRTVAAMRTAFGIDLPVQAAFLRPVLADLASAIDTLYDGARTQTIISARTDVLAPAPVSFEQERLWFFSRLDPESPAYNLSGAVRLEGALDRDALRAALTMLVARHASLRTRFTERDDVPMQLVSDMADYGWSVLDFADVAVNMRDERIASALRSIARAPFALDQGPLLRVTLICLGSDEHLLQFVVHHIVSDAWSVQIMIDEFAQSYAMARDGRSAPLPALPVQYADYAAWQRDANAQARIDSDLDFWRTRLAGDEPQVMLPYDRTPGGMRSQDGGRVSIALASLARVGVQKTARRHRTTAFVVLLAAFDLLLARYSGSEDVRVGVPVAGRERSETQSLIGFFVNTLVIRGELAGLRTIDDLLAHVRERVLEAQAHQTAPFSRVVDALRPGRSLTQTPLFNVMFNFEPALDRGTFGLPGLNVTPVESTTGTARFDLVLTARERGEGLEVSFTYARDVFDESTVARMLDHYVALLEQLGAQGDVHLGALTLEALRPQPALAAHAFAPVGERIAARAQRMPEANAVHCEGERLSYGALQAWSARIAHALQARGIGAESRVGLCLTRSPALIAALVGVLRSGGAFVPLDPAYPAERLGVMLEDAGVRCVVADAATIATCGALFAGLDVIDVNQLDAFADVAPRVTIQPEQLAYVIYTSGSTGKPKGVAVSHVALSRHLDDFIGCYGITSRDTQLQSSTINFDVALHEMLPALMQGGQVEMRGPQLWDIDTTSRHLRDGGVSFSRIPTAYWQQWLRTPPPAQELATLRQITVGGEGLPGDALAQWRRGPLAHIRLDNLYGPTETTVACMYRATTEEDTRQSIVSIGEPYASRSVQVLDRFGNEVPVGGLGELCIGGLTLARGYLNRPGLTAERFVPDPRTPGARLYRSGDLCRRRADGSIDFLGRLDQQVKLRGFRIELGEIEAALRQAEGVSAAVVALAGEGEARQLVGYVVGQSDIRTLRRTLEARLPGYMVPAAFVTLDALPLMQNGKVDRAALPAPQASAQREHVAPRTALEGELLSIWQAVLGRERIGVTENFFEIGGHSLLMMQVASRIRQELGREVTLATLFMHPVLESLAAELEAGQARAVAPIARRDEHTRIPLTYAQERLWFLWNLEPASAAYTIAGAVRLKGRLDKTAMRRALDHLVMRHESLRTRFVEEDGQAWQVVDETPRYQWSEARYEGEAQLQALSQAPLDLRAGPMLRVALLEGGAQDAVLHFAMPHIVSDAWSQTILLREFSQFYAAAVEEQEAHLEPLPIQYGDYATWQREHLNEAALQAQYAYWQHELGDEQPLLELPVDRVRHGAASSAGAWVERSIDEKLARTLDDMSRNAGATRFMTMLAAFGAVMQGYSGQRDVRIGVPVAGRDRLETQSLIGFFVNTVVIRVDTPPGASFDARLAQVRERVLGAHDHTAVPFAKLVERLQPQRSMSHTPLFQVMFDYSEAGAPLAMPGVEASALAGGTGTAQFDLSMQVSADAAGGLHIGLNYATDIFDEHTVARIIDSYVAVLEQAAQKPQRRSFELPDDAERRQLARFTHGAPLAANVALVHRRFEAHAAAHPDDIALVFEGEHINYGELNARANRVAHELIARGIAPDEKVGVALERSIDMIVAVLGVLKAGAAYVPLDLAYPAARLAHMIEDSGVAMLLTQRALRPNLHVPEVAVVVELEAIEATTTRCDDPSVTPHAQHLAYVIYTSGSTGKPKGVGMSHAAFASHVDVAIGFFGLTRADRVLQFATFNFDGFIEQLFPALCIGASVVLRGPQLWDSVTFHERVLSDRITVADLTTAYWQLLAQDFAARGVTDFGALRRVHAGGEAMSLAALKKWRAWPAPANVQLLNTYGPTEAAVTASTFDCSAAGELDALPTRVPIGAPLAGRSIHVLTPELTLAPVGVQGEVAIGGPLLARGYLNRPGLTAERFIPDPFDACGAGARLYLTGDLARWNAAGELEYLGRIDHQVKIRGFRIELGEIEAALRAQPRVRDSAAAVKEIGGEPMLVGYVVPANEDDGLDIHALRLALAAQLPAYMTPQRIVTLAALPLSPNGKLDLNALPLPSLTRDAVSGNEPQTVTEHALAAIWQSVLGVTHAGPDDDFFALGGDSLRTLQVARLAREAMLPTLGIEAIFARPRLGDLAAYLDNHADAQRDAAPASIVPMNAPDAPLDVFAIHPAYGLIAEYRTLARHLDGIASVHGVQSPVYGEPDWWAHDLDALARDYAERVRRVQPRGPYRFVGWSMGGLLAVEIAAQLEAAGETVDFIGLIDAGMQQNTTLDAAHAARVLAHRRTASQEEIAAFWDGADDARRQWRAELGETASDPGVIGHALIAIEHLQALTQAWRTREVRAPLTLWWSGQEAGAAALDEKTARWRACSASETVLAGTIDTDHVGIVRHAALLRDLAARLEALSKSEAEQEGLAHG